MIRHEHRTQLAEAERAWGAAQSRAMEDDARARRGGRGVGGHSAENPLEDDGPLQLQRQARGGQRAGPHRGYTRALQAGDSPEHVLGNLPVLETRLQSAPRHQEVAGTQVPGVRLLEPHRAAGPQRRV